MHFACFILSQYLKKFRRLKNKIRVRTIETQNLILFFISAYWNCENKTAQNTILPKSRNSVPAKLRTNKVVGPGISPPISPFHLLTTTQQKNTRFLIYSSRFLDRFECLSAEATFCTPAHPFFKFICSDFWTDLNGCQRRLLFTRQLSSHSENVASARRVQLNRSVGVN